MSICRFTDVFYNPEIFPGLVYKMKNHRLTALIFASGKYVLTGSRYLGDLNRANVVLQALLGDCKK